MKTNENIAILINPKLSYNRADKILNRLQKVLQQKNISFNVFIHPWPLEINAYKEIWLIGGDGTINYLLNYYNPILIPIAVFKGGTGNDVAWKLYGDLSYEVHAELVLRATAKPIDAAECNGRRFINGIGVGFDGEVLRSINTVRLIGGHAGYLWVVLRKIFSFREHYFTLRYDNEIIKEKFLLVMITNSSRTGGGFMVSPEANLDDGKLNMILCKPLSIFKRLLNLPVIQKGNHLDKNYIIHKLASKVVIESEINLYAQIDGELIEGKTFEITVLPKHYIFKY